MRRRTVERETRRCSATSRMVKSGRSCVCGLMRSMVGPPLASFAQTLGTMRISQAICDIRPLGATETVPNPRPNAPDLPTEPCGREGLPMAATLVMKPPRATSGHVPPPHRSSLVMKGSPVRVRASASLGLETPFWLARLLLRPAQGGDCDDAASHMPGPGQEVVAARLPGAVGARHAGFGWRDRESEVGASFGAVHHAAGLRHARYRAAVRGRPLDLGMDAQAPRGRAREGGVEPTAAHVDRVSRDEDARKDMEAPPP